MEGHHPIGPDGTTNYKCVGCGAPLLVTGRCKRTGEKEYNCTRMHKTLNPDAPQEAAL